MVTDFRKPIDRPQSIAPPRESRAPEKRTEPKKEEKEKPKIPNLSEVHSIHGDIQTEIKVDGKKVKVSSGKYSKSKKPGSVSIKGIETNIQGLKPEQKQKEITKLIDRFARATETTKRLKAIKQKRAIAPTKVVVEDFKFLKGIKQFEKKQGISIPKERLAGQARRVAERKPKEPETFFGGVGVVAPAKEPSAFKKIKRQIQEKLDVRSYKLVTTDKSGKVIGTEDIPVSQSAKQLAGVTLVGKTAASFYTGRAVTGVASKLAEIAPKTVKAAAAIGAVSWGKDIVSRARTQPTERFLLSLLPDIAFLRGAKVEQLKLSELADNPYSLTKAKGILKKYFEKPKVTEIDFIKKFKLLPKEAQRQTLKSYLKVEGKLPEVYKKGLKQSYIDTVLTEPKIKQALKTNNINKVAESQKLLEADAKILAESIADAKIRNKVAKNSKKFFSKEVKRLQKLEKEKVTKAEEQKLFNELKADAKILVESAKGAVQQARVQKRIDKYIKNWNKRIRAEPTTTEINSLKQERLKFDDKLIDLYINSRLNPGKSLLESPKKPDKIKDFNYFDFMSKQQKKKAGFKEPEIKIELKEVEFGTGKQKLKQIQIQLTEVKQKSKKLKQKQKQILEQKQVLEQKIQVQEQKQVQIQKQLQKQTQKLKQLQKLKQTQKVIQETKQIRQQLTVLQRRNQEKKQQIANLKNKFGVLSFEQKKQDQEIETVQFEKQALEEIQEQLKKQVPEEVPVIPKITPEQQKILKKLQKPIEEITPETITPKELKLIAPILAAEKAILVEEKEIIEPEKKPERRRKFQFKSRPQQITTLRSIYGRATAKEFVRKPTYTGFEVIRPTINVATNGMTRLGVAAQVKTHKRKIPSTFGGKALLKNQKVLKKYGLL